MNESTTCEADGLLVSGNYSLSSNDQLPNLLYFSLSNQSLVKERRLLECEPGRLLERTAVYRSPVHARDDMPPSQSAHEWKSDYQRNFTPITFVKEPR